jgi:hypothetical protein
MQFAFSIDSLFDLVEFFLGFGLLALGAVVQRNGADNGRDAEQDLDAPLPRARRRRNRAKTDRGLPPDEEIEKLAVAYLERQRKHWPDVAKAGLLPTGAANEIRDMVDDFKDRHRSGNVAVDPLRVFLKWGYPFEASDHYM